MHAEDPGELASLVRNLPDAAMLPARRCKIRRFVVEGREESYEEEERRAMELDGKTGEGWTVFGCL